MSEAWCEPWCEPWCCEPRDWPSTLSYEDILVLVTVAADTALPSLSDTTSPLPLRSFGTTSGKARSSGILQENGRQLSEVARL